MSINIPRGRYLLAVFLALAILAMVPAMGLAQAPATDDTYVTQTNINTNYGNATSLAVQAGTQPTYTYMTFSTSQAPNGSSVTKATLRLFVTAVTSAGAFDIRLANGPWAEGTLKWSNQPGSGPGPILFAGSCANPIPANADPTHPLCITKGQVKDYIIIDISSQVQAWVTNPASNYGIVLVPTTGYSTSITFDSKESTTTSHDPTLNILVTGAAGAAATVTVGGTTTGAAGTQANVSNSGTTSAAILNFTIPQGATGSAGPAGATGPPGPTGGTGPQGSAGAAATVTVGSTTTGTAGTAANVSNAGTTSAAILNFTIPRGATGATGPTGPQGPQGQMGATGPQGLQGTQGPAGPQGPVGAGVTAKGAFVPNTSYAANDVVNYGAASYVALLANNATLTPDTDATNWALFAASGPKGDKGDAGATGAQGAAGPQGDIGPIGLQGLQGTQGPVGPQGPVGAGVTAKGAFIPNTSYAANDVVNYGAASYVALLANNATLAPDTDAANWAVFAASGPKGDKGDTGATGPQGVPGPQGLQGLQGLVGPLGPPGPQGQQGVTGATGQGYTWKGAWSAAAAYAAYDCVSYNGSSYVALAANTNVTPGTDATKWDLLAQASLVGNFVDLQSNQTIGGTKTFSSTITGNISGSAGTISGTISKLQVSDFPALATVTTGSYGPVAATVRALAASIAASSHKFPASYSAASGTFTAAMPALGDLSRHPR